MDTEDCLWAIDVDERGGAEVRRDAPNNYAHVTVRSADSERLFLIRRKWRDRAVLGFSNDQVTIWGRMRS
jgi:hypothetical protein